MTSHPKISVIIPTYNTNHYLGEAIQSVLDQTCQDFEVIVVDDGSNPPALEIVSRFSDPRLRYFYQENQGLPAARNKGIACCRGEYLAFLDADDAFLPEKLARQVAQLESRPELAGVFSGWRYVDADGVVMFEVKPWETHPQPGLEQWLLGFPFTVHSALFQKQAVINVGKFDQSLETNEDNDLFLRIFAAGGKMALTTEVLCIYRMHLTNLTKKHDIQNGQVIMLDKFFAGEHACRVDETIKNKAYRNAWLLRAQWAFMTQNLPEAEKAIGEAVAWHPAGIDRQFWRNQIHTWALGPRVEDPFSFVEYICAHWEKFAQPDLGDKNTLLADVYIDRAFYYYGRGGWGRSFRYTLRGLRLNPTWVKNRGVRAILVKSLVNLALGRLLPPNQSAHIAPVSTEGNHYR